MKRPSRPKKRKVAPKKVVKRKKVKPQQRAKVFEEMSAEDAAIFDIAKPPAGMAYQWSSVASTERMLMKGWSRVPYSRHPELPRSLSFDGSIRYLDNVLFQIGADFVEMRMVSERNKAQAQRRGMGVEAYELMASYSEDASYRRGGERQFPLVSSSFMVSSDYVGPDTPGDVVIDLTIKFFMPYRWRDAAAALLLTPSEYVRRRLAQSGMWLTVGADGTYHASTGISDKEID